MALQGMLERIKGIDWTGPDTRHPHVIRNMTIWNGHYAFRPHSPSMLIDGVRIHRNAYGIYRPAFENHVYKNLHFSQVGPEPFNRGMDDASAQLGSITVDGLRIDDLRGGNDRHPVVHMTDNDLSGDAECHFRNVVFPSGERARRPVFNRGGSVRADPFVKDGVPYFVHDYFGPGRDAKIVSTAAADLVGDGNDYRKSFPLTGDDAVVAEVADVEWPKLLDPVDDLAPATIITSVRKEGEKLIVAGVSHDNGKIVTVTVNGKQADIVSRGPGVVDWRAEVVAAPDGLVEAFATDDSGNAESRRHRMRLTGEIVALRR